MNQIIQVIENSGIEKSTATQIKEKFLPFFEQAENWTKKAKELVVTSEDQKEEMQQAREARLQLKAIRVDADKTRKALKEDSIRYGKAVQGVYNVIEYLIKPIEEHLQQQEDYVKIQAEKRAAELLEQRKKIIEPYADYVPVNLDLSGMDEEDFQKVLSGAKLQHDHAIAEQARIRKEQEEAERKRVLHNERRIELASLSRFVEDFHTRDFSELSEEDYIGLKNTTEASLMEYEKEQERIRQENERIKAEQEEERKKAEAERKAMEEKARKEREEAAKKLESERKEREKIEAEMLKKAEEEKRIKAEQERKEREEAEAKRKLEAAPDKEKLLKLCEEIRSIQFPTVKTKRAKEMADDLKSRISSMLEKFEQAVNNI